MADPVANFDPDAFLAQQPAPIPGAAPVPPVDAIQVNQFDPDAYLNQKESEEHNALIAQYGTLPQQGLTALEGGAQGLLSKPITAAAEAGLTRLGVKGLTPEEQQAREEANPATHGFSELGAMAGPAIFSGGASLAAKAGLETPAALTGAANFLGKYSLSGALGTAGEGVAKFTAPAIGKIGSKIASGAVENMLYAAQDVGSKIVNGQDPESAVQSAIPYVGLSGVIGGGLGGGLGTISSLWKATQGEATKGVLKAITDRLGGKEGVELADPVTRALDTLGIEVKPEVRALMSENPSIQKMASTLMQSDSARGVEYQAALSNFHEAAADAVAGTFGKTAEEVANTPRLSTYEQGKDMAKELGDEVNEQVMPLSEKFDAHQIAHKDTELNPSIADRTETDKAAVVDAQKNLDKQTKAAAKAQASGDPEASIEAAAKVQDATAKLTAAQKALTIPGDIDVASDALGELANRENWLKNPDGPGAQAVQKVLKQLPLQKTLGDLTAFIKNIGDQLLEGKSYGDPMYRVAGQIKSVLRKTEGDVLARSIGSEAGPEALENFRKLQYDYSQKAHLTDELDNRLRVPGAKSTRGYGNAIIGYGEDAGEKFLSKVTGGKGQGDADLLNLIKTNFPRTAQKIKDYHINNILETVAKRTKNGAINIPAMQKAVDALSVEQKAAFISPETSGKLEAIKTLQDQMTKQPYNSSNTARVYAAMNKYGLSSALGMITMLTGHGMIATGAVSVLSQLLSKEAPDAVRLGLLKFLGSNQPISSTGFKAMVDFIQSSAKGENLITKAGESLFKGASRVIPEHERTQDRNLDALDKKLKELQDNPAGLDGIGENVGHYLGGHEVGMSAVAHKAIQYINANRPTASKQYPLDPEPEVSKEDKAKFRRILELSENPLLLTDLARQGSVTNEDVNHVMNLYPAVHAQLSQSIMNALTDHTKKGEAVPYQLRMGLSTIMGQPLDGSFAPQTVASNQAAYQSAAQQFAMNSAPHGKQSASLKGMREMKPANRISLRGSDEA